MVLSRTCDGWCILLLCIIILSLSLSLTLYNCFMDKIPRVLFPTPACIWHKTYNIAGKMNTNKQTNREAPDHQILQRTIWHCPTHLLSPATLYNGQWKKEDFIYLWNLHQSPIIKPLWYAYYSCYYWKGLKHHQSFSKIFSMGFLVVPTEKNK